MYATPLGLGNSWNSTINHSSPLFPSRPTGRDTTSRDFGIWGWYIQWIEDYNVNKVLKVWSVPLRPPTLPKLESMFPLNAMREHCGPPDKKKWLALEAATQSVLFRLVEPKSDRGGGGKQQPCEPHMQNTDHMVGLKRQLEILPVLVRCHIRPTARPWVVAVAAKVGGNAVLGVLAVHGGLDEGKGFLQHLLDSCRIVVDIDFPKSMLQGELPCPCTDRLGVVLVQAAEQCHLPDVFSLVIHSFQKGSVHIMKDLVVGDVPVLGVRGRDNGVRIEWEVVAGKESASLGMPMNDGFCPILG
jgi:hypothetical protein